MPRIRPSAADKWFKCTASPYMEAYAEKMAQHHDRDRYSHAGTIAHAAAAALLTGHKLNSNDTTASDNERIEMWAIQEYVEYVKERACGAELHVERKVRLPGGFAGRADAIILREEGSARIMEVIDFKYGEGVKYSAEDNWQLCCYALAAREDLWKDVDLVKLTIFQPRRFMNISHELLLATQLDERYEELKAKLLEIEENPTFNPGKHCRFCNAKGSCLPRHEAILSKFMDAQTIGQKLDALPMVRKQIKDIEQEALSRLRDGHSVEGYCLEDKLSSLKWNDENEAFTALSKAGMEDEAVSLVTPTQAKAMGFNIDGLADRYVVGKRLAKINRS